jgi:hypothetical protein
VERTKLTIRIDRDLLEEAKRYAREHNATLTRLVSTYLRHLGDGEDRLSVAPVVRRLSGILPQGASADDYGEYLERKYGGQA